MPFGRTYQEIKELIRNTVLDTGLARDICRRAGVFPFSGAGTGAGVPVLTFLGVQRAGDPDYTERGYDWTIEEAFSWGFFFWPDGIAKHSPRVDLTNFTEMRLTVHNRSPMPNSCHIFVTYTPEPDWGNISDIASSPWLLTDGSEIPTLPENFIEGDLPSAPLQISLFLQGGYFTDWVPIPEGMRQDVFLGFLVTGETGDLFSIGYAQLWCR